MSDENALTIASTALSISGKININMQELVSVGLAKMESRFTARIKEHTGEVTALKSEIKAAEASIDAIIESLIPDEFTAIKEYLNNAQLDSHTASIKSSYEVNQSLNFFILEIINANHNRQYGTSGVSLKVKNIPMTDAQKRWLVVISEAKETITEKNNIIVKYRQRMGNINKLERQIRARITETQLNKSQDGKDLLASFMDEFENDIEAME
jgi:hypothetical protein